MKPNTKYEKNGIQFAMYPNPVMNITQSINGSYSHRGANAIDDAQQNTGISNGYAPCDMVCVATDYVNGNAIFWQSQKPVQTRKYGLTHIYMAVVHDNTANARVGMKVRQGVQLFSEGTAGFATGNHNHIEVGIGQFGGRMYVKNQFGTWMVPGNVNPADVFFVDDTQIINGGGLNWGTTSEVNAPKPQQATSSGVPSDAIAERGTFTVSINVPIKIRNAPSVTGQDTGFVYAKGQSVNYDYYIKREGYCWISWVSHSGVRRWMATGELDARGRNSNPWGTFR